MRFAWGLLVLLIATIGVGIYSIGYNRDFNPKLEVYSYIDEARLYQEAIEMSYIPAESRTLAGYPPGLLWIFQLAHALTDGQTAATLSLVRIWVSLVNAVSLILLALIGRRLHSPSAGILASLAWLLAPFVIERVHFAMTEPFQVCFMLMALYAAVRSLMDKTPRWAVLSAFAALSALVFKYSIVPALGFGIGASLYHLIASRKSHWRPWMLVLFIQIALIGATALWFYFAYDTRQLVDRPEASQFLETDIVLLNLANYQRAFSEAIGQIGWQLSLFVPVYLLGTFIFWKQKSNLLRFIWFMMSIFVISYLTLMLFYIVFWSGVHRYTTPVSPVIVLLASLSILLILEWGLAFIKKPHFLLSYALFLLPIILWIAPQAYQTYLQIPQGATPHTTSAFAHWLAIAAPEGTINIPDAWYPLLNYWAGYSGTTRPWISETLTNRSPQDWQDLAVNYFVVSDAQRDALVSSQDTPNYLENLLLLKHFPLPETETWGDSFSVYYLSSPAIETNIGFGNQIRLYGYTIQPEIAQAGESLSVQLFWQASSLPQEDYHVFLHLVSADSLSPLAQMDGLPALATYPPSQWSDFDEIILGQPLNLTLPDNLVSGEYRLLLGLYSPNNFSRLLTEDGADTLELIRFNIP